MITEAEVEWEQDEGSHRTLLQEEEVGESAGVRDLGLQAL